MESDLTAKSSKVFAKKPQRKIYIMKRVLFKGRKEGEYSWRVTLEDLKARNYNLDIKNPHVFDKENQDPEVLLAQYHNLQDNIKNLRNELKKLLGEALQDKVG